MNTELQQRIIYFSNLFDNLQSTNSRLEKEYYLSGMPENYKEDWIYILEVLDGRHPFGYKYFITENIYNEAYAVPVFTCIKHVLQWLHQPIKCHDLTEKNIYFYVLRTQEMADFLEPIVNRTLKLGIGRSLLPKTNKSPMLAKKYEDIKSWRDVKEGFFVTEKLDGNRCIAEYVEDHWEFTSRNGKPMKVNFDMRDLDTDYVYDGEVLSMEQTLASVARTQALYLDTRIDVRKTSFNATSGLINSLTPDKNLVYNIFDVIIDEPYYVRRGILAEQAKVINSTMNTTIRILPILYQNHSAEKVTAYIAMNLGNVVDMNGEGLMLNLGDATYEHKRTNNLIKIKKTYTMDMVVTDYEFGTGKYEGEIGAIHCEATQNGCKIECDVGSGLSDEQRLEWALHPEKILDKIVEVSYFSLSQDKSVLGSTNYSLRFPRLKRVRDDKEETSVD